MKNERPKQIYRSTYRSHAGVNVNLCLKHMQAWAKLCADEAFMLEHAAELFRTANWTIRQHWDKSSVWSPVHNTVGRRWNEAWCKKKWLSNEERGIVGRGRSSHDGWFSLLPWCSKNSKWWVTCCVCDWELMSWGKFEAFRRNHHQL